MYATNNNLKPHSRNMMNKINEILNSFYLTLEPTRGAIIYIKDINNRIRGTFNPSDNTIELRNPPAVLVNKLAEVGCNTRTV